MTAAHDTEITALLRRLPLLTRRGVFGEVLAEEDAGAVETGLEG